MFWGVLLGPIVLVAGVDYVCDTPRYWQRRRGADLTYKVQALRPQRPPRRTIVSASHSEQHKSLRFNIQGLHMDAAIAALLGALIGAAGSVGGTIIQQRSQSRRDLLKIAADLASEDWKNRYELLSKRGGTMPPVSAFVRYHHKVLTALARTAFPKTLSPAQRLWRKHDFRSRRKLYWPGYLYDC